MSRVLVIGGSGFLGFHLVEELVKSGYEVTVQDVVPKESVTKFKDIMKDIKYVWKSTIDISEQDLKGVDFVVNLAAQADVNLGISSPKWTWAQNTEAVLSLMDTISQNPCKSIFMSTDVIYGRVPEDKIPITEEQKINPTNTYAASKAAMELLVTAYVEQRNLPFMVLRCAGMYGEYGRQNQVVPTFIKQARANENITVEGNGSQTRDFNYVKNTVFGITQALKSNQTNGLWNISNGKETSIRELAEKIINLTNSKSKIVEKPWRAGEKGVRLCLSIEKARKELGYEPKYSLEEGLERTIKWISNQ